MKKILLISIILVAGCYSYECNDLRNSNRKNLLKLSSGMPKQDVIQLMGECECENKFTNAVGQKWVFISATNPYRNQLHASNGKIVEILYYLTDLKNNDRAITDDELTPLFFENDKLIGWGNRYLDEHIEKYELRIR